MIKTISCQNVESISYNHGYHMQQFLHLARQTKHLLIRVIKIFFFAISLNDPPKFYLSLPFLTTTPNSNLYTVSAIVISLLAKNWPAFHNCSGSKGENKPTHHSAQVTPYEIKNMYQYLFGTYHISGIMSLRKSQKNTHN